MAKPISVSDAAFDAEVLKHDTLVLVDFWAERCRPCHEMGALLGEMSQKYGSQLKIAELDVDRNPCIPISYRVLNIPSLILFKNGLLIARWTDIPAKAEVEQTIAAYLPKA
jgi:thioredoxin 1